MNQQELETIKAELRQISDLIGPGTAYQMLMPGQQATLALLFPLRDIISLVPEKHRIPFDRHGRFIYGEQLVPLTIPDLFAKVEQGRVLVPLGFLAENLPVEHIGYVPHTEVDASIEIPMEWIHAAFWRGEETTEETTKDEQTSEDGVAGIPWSRWLQ